MKFIDLHTHSLLSSGVDTPARMHYHASILGIEIGLCDGVKSQGYTGIEINPKGKEDLKKNLDRYRQRVDYILVRGMNEKINNFAVNDKRVDILSPSNLKTGTEVSPAIAKKAEENEIAIEVNLSSIINARRFQRMKAIGNIKSNMKLSRKYGFDLIVTSGAECRYDLRSGEQVFELLKLFGFEEDAEKMMYGSPRGILKKNEEMKSEGYVADGVRVVG